MKRGLALLVWLVASLPAAAHPGIGIVLDSRGNVFYTDLRHVWKIAPDGAKSIAVANVHTHELYLDAQDNLYGEHLWYEGEATDKWGHRVWRLSAGGKLEDIIPARQGFLKNYSFVRDRQGAMYWAERGPTTVIRKRAPDGTISVHATARFQNVRWMTCTPEGTLYLIDLYDLVRIEPNGNVRVVARDLAERSFWQFFVSNEHAVYGLWPDAQGNVYVAVLAGRVVKKVTPEGKVSEFARSRPPWSPTGGLVAPNGDVWILEYRSPTLGFARVRRIQPNGTAKTF